MPFIGKKRVLLTLQFEKNEFTKEAVVEIMTWLSSLRITCECVPVGRNDKIKRSFWYMHSMSFFRVVFVVATLVIGAHQIRFFPLYIFTARYVAFARSKIAIQLSSHTGPFTRNGTSVEEQQSSMYDTTRVCRLIYCSVIYLPRMGKHTHAQYMYYVLVYNHKMRADHGIV